MHTLKPSIIKQELKKLKGTPLKLLKPNTTITDDVYGTKSGYLEYDITGIVLPSVSRDFFYRLQGTLDDGSVRIFILPEPLAGVKVALGDKIKNLVTDMTYEVLEVFEYIIENELVVIEAICR